MPAPALRLEHERFCAAVGKFIRRVGEEKGGLAVRKLAIDLTARVTKRTPMKTGRAAAGWWPFAVAHGAGLGVGGAGARRGLAEGSYSARLRGPRPFVELVNAVPYIMPLEEGARAHDIRPRRARALRFFYKGRIVFARRVRHPGMRGYHALRGSMQELRGHLEASFGGLVTP